MERYLKNFYLEYINRTHLNTIIAVVQLSDLSLIDEKYEGRIKIIHHASYYTLNRSICQYYNEEGNY